MQLSDFDYDLPEVLIAQSPAEPRDSSRLMLLDKATGHTRHHIFRDLPELLRPGDALVFNDTRVLHARLRGRRDTGAKVEILLLRPTADGRWESLARPAKRLHPGEQILLNSGSRVEIVRRLPDGLVEVELPDQMASHLSEHGELPLPPYIQGYRGDPKRYQTVYAQSDGSVAAPTAGLHFTPSLLDALRERGIGIHYITLHVGLGTFKPVKTERIEDHHMHGEQFLVPRGLMTQLQAVRRSDGRIIAVGTTVTRALETVARQPELKGGWNETSIFIKPGDEFLTIDGLVTNFHLPKSTLLMLVSALAGREKVLRAYSEAVRRKYRFYSFGDAMLLI